MSMFGVLENVIMVIKVMLTIHVYDFVYYRFFEFLVSMFNILPLLMQNIFFFFFCSLILSFLARRLTVYKILPS